MEMRMVRATRYVTPLREGGSLPAIWLASVAAGEPGGGAVAALEPSERFHWLAAPASTVVQPSPVHTGLCEDPARTLDHMFDVLVA